MSTARNKDDLRDNSSGYNSASNDIELLYVWIERDQAGFIQETGFNLSPNYRFTMKCTEDGRYKLACTENKDYYNIWKFDSINGLTALVGENGSGKSLLLRHLLKFSAAQKNIHLELSMLISLTVKCGSDITSLLSNLSMVQSTILLFRWVVRHEST